MPVARRRPLVFRLRAALPLGGRNRRTRRREPASSLGSATQAALPGSAGPPSSPGSAEPPSSPGSAGGPSSPGTAAPPRPVVVEPAARPSPARLAARRAALHVALTLVLLALLGGGVAGGSFFFYRFLTRSPHFALREIRVSPTTHLGAEDVRARSGLVVGDNLFRVDLDQAVRRVRADPWIADVKAWRELPGAVVLTVRERQPAVVVALGTLYLADARGEIFKRASPDEAAAWPIVTGVTRDGYIHDRESAQALLREACAALLAWQDGGSRAPIGEVHVDVAVGVTLYTREQGLGIRVGRVDPAPAPRAATSGGDSPSAPQAPGAAVSALAARLARVDRVLVALAVAHEHPALLLADHQAHPDRVTVQLEGPR